MTYTIIGGDGKNYGPISAEQLRRWIKENRVDSRTPVYVAGAADWTFAGLLPEFAAEFSETPPVIRPTKPVAVPASGISQMALWGFICGLLAWLFCGCCLPLAVVGLTLSIVALVQLHSRTEAGDGRGLAIAGIVLSGTNLVWGIGMYALGMLNNAAQVQWQMPH